jgi:ketosteroid isomerase-like protein
MNGQENTEIVKQMIAAFLQGKLPAGVDMLAKDIDWRPLVNLTESEGGSWAELRHKNEEVALYLKQLLEKLQPEQIETWNFTSQENQVLVEIRNPDTEKLADPIYERDWVMIFTLRDGKIVRLRHYLI